MSTNTELHATLVGPDGKPLDEWLQEQKAKVEARAADDHPDITKKVTEQAKGKTAINVGSAHIVDAAKRAEYLLASKHELEYYRRGSELVKPVHPPKSRKKQLIRRDSGAVILHPVAPEMVVWDVNENAYCYRVTKEGMPIAAAFNTRHAALLLAHAEMGYGVYRTLTMVTASPVMLADGTILTKPGFYEDSGILMYPNGIKYSEVPGHVSQEEAAAALRKFDRLFRQFPFKRARGEEWWQTPSYATLLASVLSLLARPAVQTVPIFGASSPRPGFGKSKAAKAATFAALGYGPTATHFANEGEFNKLLVPLLRNADRATLIDNVDLPFKSAPLNIAITENKFESRVLGKSEKVPLINTTVFFVTGNNLQIQGDLTRRALMATIEDDCEYPERRMFEFDPVADAEELHPELAIAGLTALRGYQHAGKPWSLPRPLLGSFEQWDRMISGTLVWAGFADPCETSRDVLASDPQRDKDLSLLAAWHEEFGEKPVTTTDIRERAEVGGTVFLLLCPTGKWDGDAVGYRLRGLKGKVLGGYKLLSDETPSHGLTQWFVKKLEP